MFGLAADAAVAPATTDFVVEGLKIIGLLLAAAFGAYLGARGRRQERKEQELKEYRRDGSALVAAGENVVDHAWPYGLRSLRLEARQGWVEAGRQRWAEQREAFLALGLGHPTAGINEAVRAAEQSIQDALNAAAQAARVISDDEQHMADMHIPSTLEVMELLRLKEARFGDSWRVSPEQADEMWATVERACQTAYDNLATLNRLLHEAAATK